MRMDCKGCDNFELSICSMFPFLEYSAQGEQPSSTGDGLVTRGGQCHGWDHWDGKGDYLYFKGVKY